MNSKYVFELSDTERDALYEDLNKIPYDPTGSTEYVTELRKAAFRSLPSHILKCLNQQKVSLNPNPYIVIENLPVDDEVFTTPDPQKFDPSAKSGFISENVIMTISSLLGEPYSMLHEGHEIVNNLIPKVENKKEYTGLGSEVELDYHIENAALKYMGDWNFSPSGLLLTGVRHDPKEPLTRVSDAREALNLLSEKDKALLREPLFKIKVPYRWRLSIPKEMQETGLVPIIHGELNYPEISVAFYPDMVSSPNPEAQVALEHFHSAVQKVGFGIDVSPGRLVYIDNRYTLHSRDKFTPSHDKTGKPYRWVQRVLIAPDLWNHRNLNQYKERVFTPIFEETPV